MLTTENNQPQNADENTEAGPDEKNLAWENNHEIIIRGMTRLIRQNEQWPSKAQLAEETGLSRQTIYRHLANFRKEDMMGDELEELKFLSSRIMAKMFGRSCAGDIKAMRLAFEITGVLKKGKAATKPEKGEATEPEKKAD